MAGILPFGAMFIELFFIFSVSTASPRGWVLPCPFTHSLPPAPLAWSTSLHLVFCLLPPMRLQTGPSTFGSPLPTLKWG